jgi:magnesium-transporting ATPase (P-type)
MKRRGLSSKLQKQGRHDLLVDDGVQAVTASHHDWSIPMWILMSSPTQSTGLGRNLIKLRWRLRRDKILQWPIGTDDMRLLTPLGSQPAAGKSAVKFLEISDSATLPLSELIRNLQSAESGLGSSDAAAILETIGSNEIDSAKRKSLLIAFIGRFTNPLVLILLFAATVSAFTGDIPSFIIIGIIVLMSVILDVTQEHHAQNAADSLRKQVSLTATALRDGKAANIPAAGIVPGDIVLLTAGDLVPADARLIEARDLFVDEALLTGEAYPAEKLVEAPDLETAPGAPFPRNLVFMGSSVVSGTAKALILATGRNTHAPCRRNHRRLPSPSAFKNSE